MTKCLPEKEIKDVEKMWELPDVRTYFTHLGINWHAEIDFDLPN